MNSAQDSAAAQFDALLVALRPSLHRYCARMVGSAIDGEDVLQDALIKAVESFPGAEPIQNPQGWLFRIAHNAALDFLRRRQRQEALRSVEEADMIADRIDEVTRRQIAATSLRTFMRLPVAQRSAIVLHYVEDFSLEEIAGITGTNVGTVKSRLHYGKHALRRLLEEAP